MVQSFHHAGVAVSDIPQAVSFYETFLGFEPLGPDDTENTIETANYFWMAISDNEWVNFAARPDVTPDRPGKNDDPHLAFRTTESEIQSIKQQLEDRDIDVQETRTSIYFRDPDKNFLEVTHWQGPAGK